MAKVNKIKKIASQGATSKKHTSKRKKTRNLYFEGIRDSLLDVVDSLEEGKQLTCREVYFPEAPKQMKAKEIVGLRKNTLHLSQHLFALLMNVSPKTVQAWEQNINTPSGAALRLLWLAQEKPDLFKSIIPHVTKKRLIPGDSSRASGRGSQV